MAPLNMPLSAIDSFMDWVIEHWCIKICTLLLMKSVTEGWLFTLEANVQHSQFVCQLKYREKSFQISEANLSRIGRTTREEMMSEHVAEWTLKIDFQN